MLIILRSHKVLSLSERCICIGKKAIFGFGTIHWGSWKVSPLDKSELLYRAGPLWSWTPSSDSPSIAPSCFSTNETKLVLPGLQPMLHPCACCSHCLKWTPHLTSNSMWPTLQSCLYHSDLSSDTSATMEANQPSRFAWNWGGFGGSKFQYADQENSQRAGTSWSPPNPSLIDRITLSFL